ncbi:hypothetical protein GCM10023321_41050 [Pseudonocardia eucalypti]|uniref:4-hydroxybenzoate polyprenyltransferase n=1 Tax=Pseudonocardia eucalypti TaxID=648755 RepID=A0ABP9QCJ8_9PSEU|nr:4-hydroxybenzoate polyprenyltransferase [Pseudonocardia eucalypti]
MPAVTDLLRLHRLEYPFPVIYLCHVGWGACYAVASVAELPRPATLITMLANLLPFVAMNALNSALDIKADAATAGKRSVSQAAGRVGSRVTIGCALGEMALAVLLATGVAVRLDRPVVAVTVGLAVLIHLLYNLEPVRLKRRGLANPLSLGLTFAVLPCLSTFTAAAGVPSAQVWLIFAGIGLLLVGRTLWWSVPDLPADAAVGDRTPVVLYGVRRALIIACAATTAALLLLGAGIAWRYGLAPAVVVVVTSGAFLAEKLRLLSGGNRARLPHERQMRRHTLTLVMIADLVLCAVPLHAAGGNP